jgi:hypothetical protein
MTGGGWFYDDLAGWLADGELNEDPPLLIFEETAAAVFGPPPVPSCEEPPSTSAIASITDSGRHHRVEASD